MTTQSQPTPTDVSPEDRRAAALLAFLILPIIVAPTATALGALVIGADPFPWNVVGYVTLAAVTLVGYVVPAILTFRRFADRFGVVSFMDNDERTRTIVFRALAVMAVFSGAALIVAGMVTASMAPFVVLTVQTAVGYLAIIYFSRTL